MPITKDQIANTTAFQRNCALNCLAHTLVGNIEKIPKTSLEVLHKAFNRYYQINLSFPEFKEAIQIENPIHREIILGPILRGMLGDTKVLGEIAEQNKRQGFDKPGQDLDDSDIVPLANFFGIHVESYSSSIYRQQAFSTLNSSIPDFSKLETAAKEKLVLAKMRELRTAHPEVQYQTNRFESEAYTNTDVDTKKQIEAIDRAHGKDVFRDVVISYPILKLWSRSEAHFEYEEVGSTEAQVHNQVYKKNDRFQYGSNRATGNPNLDGEPDADFLRKKIGQSIRTRKPGNKINLSGILTEYEKECMKQQSSKAQEGNPLSSLFGGFSDILGGGAFSSISGKIFQTFTGPFTNASGQLDFGFKPTSDGFMGIFEGIMQFGLKMFEVIQGLALVAPEIGAAFESAQQGGSDPAEDLFGLGQKLANAKNALNAFTSDVSSDGEDPHTSMTHQYQAQRQADQISRIQVEKPDGSFIPLAEHNVDSDSPRSRSPFRPGSKLPT